MTCFPQSNMDSSPNLAVKDFFPYPQIRAEQGKLLQDIDSAFQQEKILLAHAPTGLGKTATALSVALHHALEKKKRVLFLTSRHTQHAIAVETLREIKQKGIYFTTIDLVGKRSMCSQEIAGLFGNDFNDFCKTIVGRGECEFYNNVKNKQQLTVEAKKALSDLQQRYPLHNQEIMNFSREEKMCGYEIAIAMAKTATVIIADYNYLCSVENLVAKDNFMSKVKAVVDYDELINELELAAEEVRRKQKKSYLGGIAAFLEAWKGEDKGFARMLVEKETNYGPVTTLSYQCLDPRIITEPIFKQIFTGVIMSGTLTPLFMYRDILGITRAVEKEYGSPFPPENKLSLVIPETSTKYNLRGEAMFQKI